MRTTSRRRRALGQHFLIDSSVSDRAIALAGLTPGARVLEIGPGKGALTRRIVAAGHPVVAVELDDGLAAGLEKQGDPKVQILRGDFLDLDLTRLPDEPLPVIANLPYSSGTAIVERLLAHPTRFPTLVVMLQREVAERIAARPGSRSYAALSVLTAIQAEAVLAFVVPPAAFAPPPAVESAVVRLQVSPTPRVATSDVAGLRRVVKLAFGQRRKALRNALAGGLGSTSRAEAALRQAGIDPGRRAETLSLTEFVALAEACHLGSANPGGASA